MAEHDDLDCQLLFGLYRTGGTTGGDGRRPGRRRRAPRSIFVTRSSTDEVQVDESGCGVFGTHTFAAGGVQATVPGTCPIRLSVFDRRQVRAAASAFTCEERNAWETAAFGRM